jgi:hypothetical protein
VLRLSPVVFGQSPRELVQHSLIAELSDIPHLENARKKGGRPHADDQIIEGPWWPAPGVYWDFVCRSDNPPPAVWESLFEKFCTDDDTLARVPAWAVTTHGNTGRAAGFSFASEIRIEEEGGAYILTVLGVGALPEADGLALVVMAIDDWKRGSRKYDTQQPLVLDYDPDLDMFRVINLDDFSLWFRDGVPFP